MFIHFQTESMKKAMDKTFIVNAISPAQKKLIEAQPTTEPIYVDGAFMTWLRDKCLLYFVLHADTADVYEENDRLRKEEKEKQGQ